MPRGVNTYDTALLQGRNVGSANGLSIISPEIIVDNSLVSFLDAGNFVSYPASGSLWYDLSGNNINGTLTNGPTFSSNFGGAIVFDGINDFVNCGTYKFNSAQGTIGLWFKPTTSITGNAGKRPWGFTQDFEAKFSQTSGAMAIDIGGTDNLISATTSWLNTVWYNVVLTWDTSITTSRLYVQGALDSTGTTGTLAVFTSLTGTFYIGASSFNLQYIDCSVSSFIAYNRALSAAEINKNFNATRARFGV